MWEKKQKDKFKKEQEKEFLQLTYNYFEEFFIFLKKIEPLLLFLTLLIAFYNLLSFQEIPQNYEVISDRTLNSIAGGIGTIFFIIFFYWLFWMFNKKNHNQNFYNFIIPTFLGFLASILIGTSLWISSLYSEHQSNQVIVDLDVYIPILFFFLISMYFTIKSWELTQNYYLTMKSEAPTIKDRFEKYFGACISGIGSVMIIIIVTLILIIERGTLSLETFYYYILIMFLFSIFADLISQPKNKGEVYFNELLLIIYTLILYFIVFVLVIMLFISGGWQHLDQLNYWTDILNPVMTLFIVTFIPIVVGGYISYGIRKLILKNKDWFIENKNLFLINLSFKLYMKINRFRFK